MGISWKTRGVCVLSGVLLAASAAWGGQGRQQPPSVVDPAALEKEAAAEAIVARDEALQGRPFDPAYRAAIKGALTTLSPEAMDSIPAGGSPSVLGDSAADTVFTSVAPCRVINFVTIPANSQANLIVTGICGIPFGPATAVAINIVAVSPAGPGDLRAFPYGSPVPNASVINYASVSGLNIANGLVLPICNPQISNCSNADITIQADVNTVTVVADVYGYFAAPSPLFAVVNADGTRNRSSNATSSAQLVTGQYEVIFNRDVTACSYQATLGSPTTAVESPGAITVAQRAGNVNGVYILTTNLAGSDTNHNFYLDVTCPRRSGT